MYNNIKAWLEKPLSDRSLKYVMNVTRRYGKTTVLCVLALEYQLKNRDKAIPVRFTSPTGKSLKTIVRPIFRQLLKTCPDDLKPRWKTQDNEYCFPWDSEIQLAGMNNGHEDDARGTAAGLAFVDEAGMVDNLDYVCEDILMPQLLTTGGSLIISSTPPPTPDHPFLKYVQAAQLSGNYSEYNIEQTGYDPDTIAKFLEESGGRDSSSSQREYFCKFVVDINFALVPEWLELYVQDYPRHPKFFHFWQYYEAMDIGGRDFNADLFGYYDFNAAKLIIEDEIIIQTNEMTSFKIQDKHWEKEQELGLMAPGYLSRPRVFHQEVLREGTWTKNVHMRVADTNNVILLQDLGQEYGLHFQPTSKDSL